MIFKSTFNNTKHLSIKEKADNNTVYLQTKHIPTVTTGFNFVLNFSSCVHCSYKNTKIAIKLGVGVRGWKFGVIGIFMPNLNNIQK